MRYLQKIHLWLSASNRDEEELFIRQNKDFEVRTLGGEEEHTLHITDCHETAKNMCRRGLPVLALLNEGQDLSFVPYAVETLDGLDADYLEGIYRRYKKIPREIAETTHCLVRESAADDAESFLSIYAGEGITDYLAPIRPTAEKEREHITGTLAKEYEFFGYGMWTVLEKETGEVIGRAGFSYAEGYDEPQLGYVIRKEKQGRGLATEVCQAILAYARENLGFERVHIFVHPENAASVAVARKLGTAECEERDVIHFVADLS